MITRQELLNGMPSPQARQAAQRLINVAQENGGRVDYGVTGISIRRKCAAWHNPVSVAWIHLPGGRGSTKTRDFSFGAGNGEGDFFDRLPRHLRDVLNEWAGSALVGMNSSGLDDETMSARFITYEEAAANIDPLAERLANVLRELAALPAETQE